MKKEVEQSKREIKDSISELKSQIVDMKINNSLVNSQPISIYTSQLPTDKEVKKTLEDFTKSSEGHQGEEGNADDFVSDSSMYLYKVRLTLEKILRSLCERLNFTGIYSMNEMMKCVLKSEIIDKKTFDHLMQIITICNRGVHGEIVSDEYVKLVQVLLPQVIREINATSYSMGYKYHIVCPKCKFTGYTNIENECPKCRNVFIDD